MRQMKLVIQYIFGEPLMWLFYWCFQPGRFAREFEIRSAFKRIKPSLRVVLLLFLIDCPIALFTRLGLRFMLAMPSPYVSTLVVSIIVASLAGVVFGLSAGILGLGLTGGISLGLTSGISLGFVVNTTYASTEAYILAVVASGLIITCLLNVAGGRAGNDVLSGMIAGVGTGVVAGLTTDFVTAGNAVADMVIGSMVGMIAGIIASRRKARPLGGAHPRGRSLIIMVVLTGVVIVLSGWVWASGIIFALTFLLIFYRIPFYLVSGFSTWKAAQASRKQPSRVFTYLQRSALYWDELVYLPLPGLTQMLTIASEQNSERALEGVMFIVMERPLQISAARVAALEIAFHDLEIRDTLRAISEASLRLSEIFPHGTGLIDPQWSMILIHLHDASQNATQAHSPVGWQARYNALEATLNNLKQIHPNTAFNDIDMNRRLADIITLWQEVVLRELDTLEKAPEKTRRISNPYNPGPALEQHSKLFVGRDDLAAHLSEALARRDLHPTFLLYGERRMGKSSVLKHLPNLLGARFLPVFYDLQSPDSTASIAAFLGMIAEEIVLVMKIRGLKAKKLEYERLKEARRENEAEVYYLFNRWLKSIERTLEREERTLLLLFDEFEKLDKAGKERFLDLELLLNWFRSIMQHHPRVALLFSGIQTFGAMEMNWAGYFVNVQTLKVSFLQWSEAYQLITQSIQGLPVAQIFGPGVIEEILRVTNCHPFLVQALSSALIDALNARRREQIEMHDVERAINALFKNWGNTYFRDLWERTDAVQRICLALLKKQGSCDLLSIEQQSGLNTSAVHRGIEVLVDRDLVQESEQGTYQIAAPLFRTWVERNEMLS